MAGMIRREDIAAVREACRIEEVVGEHVTLKSAGVGALKGLCPFHDEKTPSFHVRPVVGLWHCFGCGEGGDVISFIQKINHMSFVEAVEMLAQRYSITLHYEEGGRRVREEEPGKRQRLLDAHNVAEDFYREQLMSHEAKPGRAFLANRGFSQSDSAQFGIGYSPQSWDSLTRLLRSRGFTDAEILAAGLASQGNRGIYDRFRGRLMWPIRDITGATVGFGARRLDDSDTNSPKYLNTPETAIYHKSQVLYGLDLAKREISRRRRIVIVEGYTDVMAAHVAGEVTAVATCGTAFGSEHVKIVRRLLGDSADPAAGVVLSSGRAHGGEIIFTFDGDEAGRKAALRAFGEDQNFSAQTFVAVEASGLDPCDLRLRSGDQAVLNLVNSRTPLFEFVIRSLLRLQDLNTAEGRVAALHAASPVVAGIKDRALRNEYTRSLAGWLGMDMRDVAKSVRTAPRMASNQGGRYAQARSYTSPSAMDMAGTGVPGRVPAAVMDDPVANLERQALEVLIQRPVDVVDSGFEELGGEACTVPAHRAVHDAGRAIGGLQTFTDMLTRAEDSMGRGDAAEAAATKKFAEAIRESAGPVVDAVVTQLAVAPLPQDRPDQMRSFSRGIIAAMVRMDLTRRSAELHAKLQRMNSDDERYAETFTELMKCEERRRAFAEQN